MQLCEKMNSNKFTIKPAGRHILTIGSDLIKDKYAAVVELVKNAFDADSPSVDIKFSTFTRDGKEYLKIEISDKGHGMNREDVTEKWMVPSTRDKLERKYSPKGRKLQGEKGIGRYAASILGDDLLLETIGLENTRTTLYLIWNDFYEAKYLEDVEILIESETSNLDSGTRLTMTGEWEKYLDDWTKKEIDKLRSELKKLIPPPNQSEMEDTDSFKITLQFENFPVSGYENFKEEIEPYQLFDLYDYRISGKVSPDGVASLIYHNNKIRNSTHKAIDDFKITLNKNDLNPDFQAYCGELDLDFRVFDRERDAIETLIDRGLKDHKSGQIVGLREARIILDEYSGIGVYRNGFRIRPLGDPGYDWLELDKRRVQKPAYNIGSNQIIGYIRIQSPEFSNLEEKSARDGLKENKYYYGLIEISLQVLAKLEVKRYLFREKEGLGRKTHRINEQIQKLFEYDDLKAGISKFLDKFSIEKSDQDEILRLIDEKAMQNNRIVQEIKDIVAIYEKHATMGKIVNVVLHEGRNAISYLNNVIPLFPKWQERLNENYEPELLEKVVSRLNSIVTNIQVISTLFNKLDPLAARKRTKRKKFKLLDAINNAFQIFENQLSEKGIIKLIDCGDDIEISGWPDDYVMALVNLIDNSTYWLETGDRSTKKISIVVYDEKDAVLIDYRDNGPGIETSLIESEVIFDPEFSTKPDGMGLGLAIAGEALDRNNGKLKAIYSSEGAHFNIEVAKEGIDE
jgi:signal transduction histidine kinase